MSEDSDNEILVDLFKEPACSIVAQNVDYEMHELEIGSESGAVVYAQPESESQLLEESLLISTSDSVCNSDLRCSVEYEPTEVFKETEIVSTKGKEKPQRMAKLQPNFFFAIQVKHVQIRNQALVIQNHITRKDARLSRAVIKPASFHITLGVVHLKNQQEIEMIKDVFNRVLSDFSHDFIKDPLRLDFQGIGSFRGQVLYAKLRDETAVTDRLKPVIEKLLVEVRNAGLLVTDKREWKPHLTLLKLSKNPKLLREVKRINPSMFSEFKDIDFGYESVESIQLCSMNGPKDSDGYYTKVAEFYFGERILMAAEPSSLLTRRLKTLTETTSSIKRKIHSLMVADEKKPKIDEKDEVRSKSLKYVAAAGAIALGALVAVKTLKRSS